MMLTPSHPKVGCSEQWNTLPAVVELVEFSVSFRVLSSCFYETKMSFKNYDMERVWKLESLTVLPNAAWFKPNQTKPNHHQSLGLYLFARCDFEISFLIHLPYLKATVMQKFYTLGLGLRLQSMLLHYTVYSFGAFIGYICPQDLVKTEYYYINLLKTFFLFFPYHVFFQEMIQYISFWGHLK